MRFEDWPERLFAFVDAARPKPFEWGTHDCMRFAIGAAQSMGADDPFGDLTWHDARSALRLLEQLGGLEALLDSRLESIDPRLAQRGDWCLVIFETDPAVGVCLGPDVAGPSRNGLEFIPIARARRAWKVGRA